MGSFNDLMGLYHWIGNEPDQSIKDLKRNRLRKEAEKSLKLHSIPSKSLPRNSAPKDIGTKSGSK